MERTLCNKCHVKKVMRQMSWNKYYATNVMEQTLCDKCHGTNAMRQMSRDKCLKSIYLKLVKKHGKQLYTDSDDG
jgi:ribosomal protein L40E